MRALQRQAAVHGAEVHHRTGAVLVSPTANGVVARTDDCEWRAGMGVVACGSWAPKVLEGVALPPLLVTREQVFYFRPRDAGGPWPSFIHHRTPYIYGLDTPGFGVKVAEHHTGAETDPDERSFEVDREGEKRVLRYVEEWFPGLDAQPACAETCLYTNTSDERFLVERHGPIVVGSACSGHGFKFAPLIGEQLARLATENRAF